MPMGPMGAWHGEYNPAEQSAPVLPPPPGMDIPPPPQGGGMEVSPEGKGPSFWERLKPQLPALLGLGVAAIGGHKSGLGQAGLGFAQGANEQYMNRLEAQRKQEAETEMNTIKNVDKMMEKLSRLSDPSDGRHARAQQIVRQYQQFMTDGKLTGKEAAKIMADAAGIGDIEGMLQESELKREQQKAQALAEINDKLRRQNEVDTPYGRMDPSKWAEIQAREAAEAGKEGRFDRTQQAMMDRFQMMEAGREDRFNRSQERLGEQFGVKQDEKFQAKLSDFYGAEEALNRIEGALDRFVNTSPINFMEKGLAGADLQSASTSLSTLIGRNLGERGVFTDQDREAFKRIITPGLVITQLRPDEAKRRFAALKTLLANVKARELDAFMARRPGSTLPEVQRHNGGISSPAGATIPPPPGTDPDPLGILQ